MSGTYVEDLHLRMVLVGKTGVGKSASGNTILGRNAFESKSSISSVTSVCEKVTGQVDGQILAVVDTPGLFDNRRSEEQVKREVGRCISFAAPGPHVFLVVIKTGRFTQEERKTLTIIQKIFGEEAARYTMVLFTRGDDLEASGTKIETLITEHEALHDFIQQCGGRYHVFNNSSEDPAQVRELLVKISRMVQRNGKRYYTNETLQGAERAIREEMEQLQRENAQLVEEEARRRAERKNGFLKAVGIGAGVGSVLGPLGAALGAAVGATVEAIKRGECLLQ